MDLKFPPSFTALRVIRTSLFYPHISIVLIFSSVVDSIQRSRNKREITFESIILKTLASLLLETFRFKYKNDNEEKEMISFHISKSIASKSSDLIFVSKT